VFDHRPEGDLGDAQAIEIQRVLALRRHGLHLAMCSSMNSAISGPVRSSTMISIAPPARREQEEYSSTNEEARIGLL
jgi:hypothetical protein